MFSNINSIIVRKDPVLAQRREAALFSSPFPYVPFPTRPISHISRFHASNDIILEHRCRYMADGTMIKGPAQFHMNIPKVVKVERSNAWDQKPATSATAPAAAARRIFALS